MDNHSRAVLGANKRWHSPDPKATHSGILQIGGQELDCDVLENGIRVIRQNNFLKAMGRGKVGGEDRKRAELANLPIFLSSNNLTPYLEGKIHEWAAPIIYRGPNGKKFKGYDARLLPEACKVYVKAADEKALHENQLKIGYICRAMLYGLATVGIIALVDSCTGYEKVRERSELEKILSKYINEELRQWTKIFPDSFFEQAYKIHGWEYPKVRKNHPSCLGNFINIYIYKKLPERVLEELMKKNPMNDNGFRKHKHHQFLSENIGEEHLKKQITSVTTLMRAAKNLDTYKELAENVWPS